MLWLVRPEGNSVYDEETKRSTMMEGDGQASRVDLKGVLQDVTTTSNVDEDTSV